MSTRSSGRRRILISAYACEPAVARTVGWVAQWKEMIEDPSQKWDCRRCWWPPSSTTLSF